MTKKGIILFFIVLLILNTFFWINVLTQRLPTMGSFKTWKSLSGDTTTQDTEIKIRKYTYNEKLEYALRDLKHSKGIIILLVITDAILVTISFMIILLYKNEKKR